jgi:hypothetical protein
MPEKKQDITVQMVIDAFCHADWCTMTYRQLYRKLHFERRKGDWLAVQAYIEKHSNRETNIPGQPLFKITWQPRGQYKVRFVGYDATFWEDDSMIGRQTTPSTPDKQS